MNFVGNTGLSGIAPPPNKIGSGVGAQIIYSRKILGVPIELGAMFFKYLAKENKNA